MISIYVVCWSTQDNIICKTIDKLYFVHGEMLKIDKLKASNMKIKISIDKWYSFYLQCIICALEFNDNRHIGSVWKTDCRGQGKESELQLLFIFTVHPKIFNCTLTVELPKKNFSIICWLLDARISYVPEFALSFECTRMGRNRAFLLRQGWGTGDTRISFYEPRGTTGVKFNWLKWIPRVYLVIPGRLVNPKPGVVDLRPQ